MDMRSDRPKLVLASQSPSRKMLLEKTGIPFEVMVSGVDETVDEGLSAAETVEYLARKKGRAVAALRQDSAVIAADSVVSFGGLTLGKPKDDDDAFNMLKALSGRTHEVITGVCILWQACEEIFHMATEVTFYELTDTEIRNYVSRGESRGRAGSYGIEGIGAYLVKKIDGDYPNVVGLPVAETLRRLNRITEGLFSF